MNCPVCNSQDTKVLDSRLNGGGFSIRRRRACKKCKFRFSTIEEARILELTVVKRDGRRENYNQEKMVKGIKISLEKRAYREEDFQKLIRDIEKDIQKISSSELTSKQLGEVLMKRLKSFDQVAYIRYASVYRSFKDAKTFQKELNQLLKKKKA